MSKRGIFATSEPGTAKTVLLKNLLRWRADDIRPYMAYATELPPQKFRGVVGADDIRPVVFPTGKQRRRIAPTMHHRTFANEIRRYNVEIWYIGNIGAPVGV